MAQVNPTSGPMNGKLGISADSGKGTAPQYDYGHDARDKVGTKPTIAAVRRTPPVRPGRGNHDPALLGG
jgi:hypothetical protein